MPGITRAKSAINVDKGDLQRLSKEIFSLVEEIESLKTRREIVEPAGEILKEEARRLAPRGRYKHHRYNTPKLFSGLRAPNGLGVKVATYVPGNLRNAIIDIANRRKKYRTFRVIIGPFYRGRRGSLKSGLYGTSERTADGYYAHMVFGGTKAFRRNVTGRALSNKRGPILDSIRSRLLRHLRQRVDKKKYLDLK